MNSCSVPGPLVLETEEKGTHLYLGGANSGRLAWFHDLGNSNSLVLIKCASQLSSTPQPVKELRETSIKYSFVIYCLFQQKLKKKS